MGKMKQMASLLILAFLLCSCAYHSVGTPDESMYVASNECAWSTSNSDSAGVMVAALPFGAIGGAIAGAASASTNGPSRQQKIDNCMASHGWVKN